MLTPLKIHLKTYILEAVKAAACKKSSKLLSDFFAIF